MKKLSKKIKAVITVIFLIDLIFIVFGHTLKYDFIQWDDHRYILENETVKSFDVKKMFTQLDSKMYKPLTLLSFGTEYKFFKTF